jgi:DNA-binding CsgD family transcriptional regulator
MVTAGPGHRFGPKLSSLAMSATRRAAAPLLERKGELAAVMRVVDAAREGRGGLVVVEGVAGIGKTALLTRARAEAEAAGMRVIAARGAEFEHEWAFGVVRQLLEPVLAAVSGDEREELLAGAAGVAARLLDLAGAGDDEGAEPVGADPSFAVLHGLYWLCANLAARSSVCLVVDDAQWADVSSLRFLAFLASRLEELPLAVLLGQRPPDAGPAADLLVTLGTDPAAEVVRPAPLSQAAVVQILEAALASPCDAAFGAASHGATGGVPFLVGQLVTALSEEGLTPDARSASRVEQEGAGGIGRWMLARLGRMPEPAGRLARAVAVLETGSLRHAAALAGLDAAEAAEAADLLAGAGIFARGRPLAFAHPLLRAGVYGEMGGAERAAAHRRAAVLLTEEHAQDERAVEHLLASEPADDPAVVDRLRSAARSAMRRGGAESAAAYLRRALAEPPAPERRGEVLLELGVAEVNAGRAVAFEHLQAAAEAPGTGSTRLTAGMVLAHVLGRIEHYDAAIEALDRAARLVDSRDETAAMQLEALAVSIAMLDVSTASRYRERIDAVRERAATAASPSRELLAVAALVAVEANEPARVAAELARRAIAASPNPWPEPTDPPWFPQAAVTLVWTESYDEAQALLDVVIARAHKTADAGLLSAALAYRAWAGLKQGALVAAEGDCRTALSAADLPVPELYRALDASLLIDALVEQGELEGAAGCLAQVDDLAEGGSQTAAVLRLSRARLRRAQGRLDEALADALAAGEVALATGAPSPSWLPWRSEAAHLHLALGERDAAGTLAAEEVRLARRFGAPDTLGVALRAAGLAAGRREGEALLREAVASHERGSGEVARAHALADLGSMALRAKRATEARVLLREALDIAHRRRARPLADRAEAQLRAAGARPRRVALTGVDSLTASERRVAELAGEGLTNRAIGEALFVTARTVEGHLTKVFRKLGASSREELAAALASGD